MKIKFSFSISVSTSIVAFLLLSFIFFSCSHNKNNEEASAHDKKKALEQVMYVQHLYNHSPEEEIVPKIQAVVDSMGNEWKSPFYFAAVNVLIDRLFSEGRFAEADSLAVRMEEEAYAVSDSLSMAMAKRVRAQMFYKLSQPARALDELLPAGNLIANPYNSGSDFGTSTSIQEWMWIISREIGDTAKMNAAGLKYAELVEKNGAINNWTDSTGHYPATALAFRAQERFSKGKNEEAKILIDSAQKFVIELLPSRAYEHLYAVRSRLRAADSNWDGAVADADTLLSTHKDFPWFYVKDLLLKAQILQEAGRYEESANLYSQYQAFNDSLTRQIYDKRLHDLTVLYRTNLEREHHRADKFRIYTFGSIVFFLAILLTLALLLNHKEKKRNRFLVERLKEFDQAYETSHHNELIKELKEETLIERLDRHMLIERPYTDPALSRKELADYCGISQEALGQLIKTEKGISVRNYINSFRLEEARKILGSESREGVAEIALRLGFGTARTLQRAFKERYDMSPSQYRDTYKEIEDKNE